MNRFGIFQVKLVIFTILEIDDSPPHTDKIKAPDKRKQTTSCGTVVEKKFAFPKLTNKEISNEKLNLINKIRWIYELKEFSNS